MKNMEQGREQYALEKKSLARKSGGAILGTLLSRLSGVFRTIIVNAHFGAGLFLDCFNAAFRFPNALRDLLADGALSAAFIKVYVDTLERPLAEQRKLVGIIFGFFLCITLLLAALGAYFALPFMQLVSSSHFQVEGGLALAATLFQVLVFFLPFTTVNALFMAILGVHGQTFRAMNASLFLSLGMILGATVFAPLFSSYGHLEIFGLVLGTMLGVTLQLFYQLFPLVKLQVLPLPNFNVLQWINFAPLRQVLLLLFPRFIGQGALTLALIINTYFAIRLGNGVLTYVVTAVTIIQVPIGLFGVATGFAAQPMLTKALNEGDEKKFSQLLTESLRGSLWLALLACGAFALFIVPFYRVIFQHGKITFIDTIENSIAVCAYASGILFSAGSKVLLNAFYAINVTKQIILNSFVYLFFNIILNYYFVEKFGVIGLGLSFGIATAIDFFLNYFFLRYFYRKRGYQEGPFVTSKSGRLLGLQICFFSLVAFFLSLCGVFLIKHFWVHFSHYVGYDLSLTTAFLVLGVGGLLYALFCIMLLFLWGPAFIRKKIIKRG